MVEGIVVANGLDRARADTVRAAPWLAIAELAMAINGQAAMAGPTPGPRVGPTQLASVA